MPHSITILHLSDMHERGPREDEAWRRQRVLGDAWLASLDELRQEGTVDLVCFTGDLANSGQADEYAVAGEWLTKSLSRLEVPRERLFLVPGNHDIDRSQAIDAWKCLRDTLPRCDPQAVSRWFASNNAPFGLDNALRDSVLTRQAAYRQFLRDFGLADLLPVPDVHGRLGFRKTLRLPGRPFNIHMLGLDSAWLAGANDDAGKLLLTEDQVCRLGSDAKGAALVGLRVALVHHPLTDLGDGTHCRRLLAEHADVLLRGHQHEPEPELWADPERRLLQLAAGCIFEGHKADHYPNGHQLVRIWLDDNGRPQRYELRFRSYATRGFWHDDSSLYRMAKQGRLTLSADGRTLTAPKIFIVPFEENPYFTGRSQTISELRLSLTDGNLVAITQRQALSGLGGVGKTQIALAYTYRHRTDYEAVFWLDASSEATLRAGFAEQANALGLVDSDAGKSIDTNAMLFKRWLQQTGRWLLVLDNADEPAELKSLVPQNAKGHILLTSRAQNLQSLSIVRPVEVHCFSNEEAVEFLLVRTERRTAPLVERYAAVELAKVLGELPLALEQAAAFIVEQRMPIADYLTSFRQMEHALLARTPPQLGNYPHTVATTWLVNFEQLKPNRNAVAALRICALLGPAPIPFELICAVAPDFDPNLARALRDIDANPMALEDILRPLLRYSLVHREAGARAVTMHRLVQAVAKDNVLGQEEMEYARRLVLPLSLHFPRPDESSDWPACERWVSHALAVINACERFQFVDDASARLHNQVALYLDARTQDSRAELLFERAIERRRRIERSDLADTGNRQNLAVALCNLAAVYIDRGSLQAAEPLLNEAIDTIEKREGPNSPSLCMPLVNRAQWLRFCGRPGEAVACTDRASRLLKQSSVMTEHFGVRVLMERALGLLACGRSAEVEDAFVAAEAACESRHGAGSDRYAELQQQRSKILRGRGQVQDAEALARSALEQARKNLGETHPRAVDATQTLALALAERGGFSEALSLFQTVTQHRLAELGPDHYRYVEALRNEATCFRGLADYVRAAQLAEHAVCIGDAEGAAEKPRFEELNELGLIYYAQGRHADAQQVLRRALHTVEKKFGTEHEQTATAHNNLALVHEAQAHYAAAEREYQVAADIAKRCLGDSHPDYFLKLHNLAHLRVFLGQHDQALLLYEQVLAGWKRSYGDVHDKVAVCLNGMCAAALAAGDAARAERYAEESMHIAERVHGVHHPGLAHSMGALAQCYQAQQLWEKASLQYRRSLEVLAVAGTGDLLRASLLAGLGACLLHMAQLNEAEITLLEALQLKQRLLGPRHPELTVVLSELGGCLLRQNKIAEAERYLVLTRGLVKDVHGERHPSYATILSNLAFFHRGQGRLGEAIELEKTVASLREEILGASHPDVALAYVTLAEMQADHGEHEAAERSLANASRCRAVQKTSQPHQLAVELRQQGEAQRRFGQFAAAVKSFEQSVEAAVAAFGRNSAEHFIGLCKLIGTLVESEQAHLAGPHIETADDLVQNIKSQRPDLQVNYHNVKGIYLLHRGRLAEAEIELQATLVDTGVPGPESALIVVQSLNTLASIAEARRDYVCADRHYRSAKEQLSTIPSGRERDDLEQMTLINSSQVHVALGHIQDAEDALEQARAIVDRNLPKLHPLRVTLFQRRAHLLAKRGDAQGELVLYKQAVDMAEILWTDPVPLQGDLLRSLGAAYRRLGQPADALAALGKARRIHEQSQGAASDAVRQDLVELAQVERRMGEPQQAVAYAEQALTISRGMQPREQESIVADTMLLGLIHQAAGNLQSAIQATRATLAEVHSETERAMLLFALAGFQKQSGDPAAALESYATVESFHRKRTPQSEADRSMLASVLQNRAECLFQHGDRDSARSLFNESIQLQHSLTRQNKVELAKATWNLACLELVSEDLENALIQAQKAFSTAIESNDGWSVATIGQGLAQVLVACARRDEAVELLSAMQEQFSTAAGASHPLSMEIAEALRVLLEQPGDKVDESEYSTEVS